MSEFETVAEYDRRIAEKRFKRKMSLVKLVGIALVIVCVWFDIPIGTVIGLGIISSAYMLESKMMDYTTLWVFSIIGFITILRILGITYNTMNENSTPYLVVFFVGYTIAYIFEWRHDQNANKRKK